METDTLVADPPPETTTCTHTLAPTRIEIPIQVGMETSILYYRGPEITVLPAVKTYFNFPTTLPYQPKRSLFPRFQIFYDPTSKTGAIVSRTGISHEDMVLMIVAPNVGEILGGSRWSHYDELRETVVSYLPSRKYGAPHKGTEGILFNVRPVIPKDPPRSEGISSG